MVGRRGEARAVVADAGGLALPASLLRPAACAASAAKVGVGKATVSRRADAARTAACAAL